MIEVHYEGRLGNRLFQYCFGRILAQGLGYELRAEAIPGFPKTAMPLTGSRYDTPEQTLTSHRVDLASVLEDRTPRKIVLKGWFQCHEYYRPYRDQIREWLTFGPAVRVPGVKADVVVNVRRTDFIRLGWALPYAFYEEALKRLGAVSGKVWIVTDDARDPFFRHFRHWEPRFFHGNATEQLLFMARASRLIMSQSTFSWWAAFLGNANEILCPVPSFGAWSPQGEAAEATLMEYDRFICLESREPYVPTSAETRHQEWRHFKRKVTFKLNHSFGFSLPIPPP